MREDRELKTGPAAAFDVLRAYLEARATFTVQELEIIRAAFPYKHLPAGGFLLRAGDTTRHVAFVAAGCLRKYTIDPNGKEHIVQFAPETWWVGGAFGPAPSSYFIDAIEDCELLLLDWQSNERLVEQIPGVATVFRIGIQRHAAATNQRIVSSLSASAEDRYLEFLKVYPSIAQRVPQSMLASYLGMTPETVSRIRKNLSRR